MSIRINSPQIAALRAEIEKIIGKMHSHSKFIKLQELIYIKCKEHISVSTLERIWGYSTRNVENVSIKTLDIISNFVDADCWTTFCENLRNTNKKESLIFKDKDAIKTEDIPVGTSIRIAWLPDRICEIEYLGANRFITLRSENASIKAGDTFRCLTIQKGRELYMDSLTLKGEAESDCRYVVGQINGLTSVEIID